MLLGIEVGTEDLEDMMLELIRHGTTIMIRDASTMIMVLTKTALNLA